VDTSEAVSGGLHVHHDIKDLIEIESENSAILDKFHVFQESIYSLCKNYRNDNEYCSKISMQSIESGEKQNRTVGFNITPYKTMEFRMRESISDVGAILRWIKLTQQVVESAAIGLIEDHKKFQNKVHETLDLIQFEKALQVKKIEKNTMLIKELDRYNQARSFADLMMEEKLTKI
jgi:hypothetical protein